MDDRTNPVAPRWTASPSAKEKNAVQREVTALLDELAPERVLKRGAQLRVPVEQHRTPTGCVLQAATAAVSVSWFVDAGPGAALGELHIIAWQGIVSRRGSPQRSEAATLMNELVLHPIERSANEWVWRATNGVEYDTASLAARCIEILEEQMRVDQTPDAGE
ncbi:MAG: hypothetical protein ACM37U_02840 [Gemmatimonas sp.]